MNIFYPGDINDSTDGKLLKESYPTVAYYNFIMVFVNLSTISAHPRRRFPTRILIFRLGVISDFNRQESPDGDFFPRGNGYFNRRRRMSQKHP
ncbi:MAG: hypothetical protein L6Q59_01425 [Ignavibacteriaceae bacterium]|nr:hypothetical protein [Ignavibacteriaceae bacterium]